MFDRISNMGRYAEPVAKAALQRILVRLTMSLLSIAYLPQPTNRKPSILRRITV